MASDRLPAQPSGMRARPLVERMRDLERGEAARRYAALVVGAPGWRAWLRYELIATVVLPCPGALGYWLRRRLVPRLLAAMGAGGAIGRSVTLRCPGRIALGRNVTLDDGVTLDAKGERTTRLVVGDDVFIGRGTHLACTDGSIRIGSFVSIGPGVYIAAKGDVTIGDFVGIGPRALLLSGGHDLRADGTPMLKQPRTARPIVVGDDVLIGAGAVVLEGATIGTGAVVGAGAVVTADVPPGAIVGGVPARLLRWRREP
ncbi:MAG TPA: acyltransferase [Thermodesulfobacteriota bacterium]|nr:acyltransferase [Thermodesulfobacteriota bacterium]